MTKLCFKVHEKVKYAFVTSVVYAKSFEIDGNILLQKMLLH